MSGKVVGAGRGLHPVAGAKAGLGVGRIAGESEAGGGGPAVCRGGGPAVGRSEGEGLMVGHVV